MLFFTNSFEKNIILNFFLINNSGRQIIQIVASTKTVWCKIEKIKISKQVHNKRKHLSCVKMNKNKNQFSKKMFKHLLDIPLQMNWSFRIKKKTLTLKNIVE